MDQHCYLVLACPFCRHKHVHHVVMDGDEVFLCCHGCFEARRLPALVPGQEPPEAGT